MRGPVRWLADWLSGVDAATEAESPRSGAFSYSVEWHAFQIGLAVGFAAFVPSREVKAFIFNNLGYDISGETPRLAAMAEAKQESWYASGGLIVGAILALVLEIGFLIAGFYALELSTQQDLSRELGNIVLSTTLIVPGSRSCGSG